jgi:hypothetical protein
MRPEAALTDWLEDPVARARERARTNAHGIGAAYAGREEDAPDEGWARVVVVSDGERDARVTVRCAHVVAYEDPNHAALVELVERRMARRRAAALAMAMAIPPIVLGVKDLVQIFT